METQMINQGMDYEIINAVDGSSYEKSKVSWLCDKFCTNTMIGCMLSHIKCWEYIVEKDLDYALILEDDVKLQDDVVKESKKLIDSVKNDTWDIILIGCFLCKYEDNDFVSKFIMKTGRLFEKAEDKPYNDVLYTPFTWSGTHSYIVSKEGAIKMLEKVKGKASYHVDYIISRFDIKTLAAIKKLAYQNADAEESHNASSMSFLNFKKLDHGDLDIDFIMTMPMMSIFNYKVNSIRVIYLVFIIILMIAIRFIKKK